MTDPNADTDPHVDDESAIDRTHLARYTLGNPELEAEILDLFSGQVATLLKAVLSAESQAEWRFATHSIKGSARAVGAWDLAETAERLEQLTPKSNAANAEIEHLIEAVAEAVEAAERVSA
ncbi:MAG: Hpt domain-containing protein [Pseudomonadota bacterium]